MPMSAMSFINKLYNKVIFSDAPDLNITAFDMGIGQCKLSLQKPGVARLETATGTVGSLEIFVPVDMTVQIKKTSPAAGQWLKRYIENGYIGGSVTLYDDVNNSYTAIDPSMKVDEAGPFNGTEPMVEFTVQANFRVNVKALSGF
mgnify:FL=1